MKTKLCGTAAEKFKLSVATHPQKSKGQNNSDGEPMTATSTFTQLLGPDAEKRMCSLSCPVMLKSVSEQSIGLRFVRVYCPRHAGEKGNDRADRLAGKAALTSALLLGRSEVLRSLRHYLRAQSQGHHTTDRLEERSVERRSARRSSLKGRERAIVSQTNIGTISKATLGELLRDAVERI